MPKSINITGQAGKNYNLEEIASKETRSDSSSELLIQVWYWNPNLPSTNDHSKPNPPSPEIGQIWLSRMITAESDPENYNIIAGGE